MKIRKSHLFLLCLMFSVLFCVACAHTDSLFTAVQAALAGVGIVITGLGALLPASEASLVEGVVAAVGDGVSAIQAAWDAYEANPSGVGLLAALQAAVTDLQGKIPGLLSGLNITNPTLLAWINTLVGLVGKLLSSIAADILPKLADAAAAHAAGDSTQIKSLAEDFKLLTQEFIDAHNAALDSSGLPPDVIADVHKHFNSAKK